MTILEKMLGNCESYGLKPTENIEKVAKAKSRTFGGNRIFTLAVYNG